MSKQALFPIGNIRTPDRLRAVDQEWAKGIAHSILSTGGGKKHLGMSQPIVLKATSKDGSAELVDGAHRLEAARILGWDEVPYVTATGNELELRLQQVDANLFHRALNPLDRAVFLYERKTIYEELHPEIKNGGDRKSFDFVSENQKGKLSFRSDTAERLGIDPRTVSRFLEIMKIVPDVRARLVGTHWADSQKELLDLAKCGEKQQRRVIEIMLDEENPAESVADAIAKDEKRKPKKNTPFFGWSARWKNWPTRDKRSFFDDRIDDGSLPKYLKERAEKGDPVTY